MDPEPLTAGPVLFPVLTGETNVPFLTAERRGGAEEHAVLGMSHGALARCLATSFSVDLGFKCCSPFTLNVLRLYHQALRSCSLPPASKPAYSHFCDLCHGYGSGLGLTFG